MKKYIIGVDIGGTKIATGMVDKSGNLIKKVVLPTRSKEGVKVSLNQVYQSIDDLLKISEVKKKDIVGIGVCAPGPLDPIKGIVHNPPNLHGWREVPLAALLKKRFNKKTILENDANAAGLAEVIWGRAKGYKNVFYVTVSTGIGTAIIIDGKIYHGKNGMAGEGGHVTINYDAKDATCACGGAGHIEALASGPGTVKRLKKILKEKSYRKTIITDMVEGDLDKISMITVGEAARKKDKLAIDVIKEEGRILGIWLGSMINLLDPDIIVIGGGVSSIGKLLFAEIRKAAISSSINIYAKKTPIVQAELKKDVGVFGAAAMFM